MRTITYYLLGALIGATSALLLDRLGWIEDRHAEVAAVPVTTTATQAEPVIVAEPDPTPVLKLNESISSSRQNAVTLAVQKVSPAVVGINVISVRQVIARHPFADDPFMRQFFPDQIYRQKVENLGSGFIISADGYVLTNEHVVHQASQVVVTATDGRKFDAKVLGFDYDSDVALLKIEESDLPYIPFGETDDVLIGEWAVAIGNPFGLFSIHSQPTVTVGVVSATDRDFDRNQEGRLYQDMIQTDAAINRGNSGGPLVNAAGELIGMNTMIFTEGGGGSIGLGFAIPSTKLKAMVGELKHGGKIDRDFWVGLNVQDVTPRIARGLQLPEARGVVVTDVEPGSPAAKAGIQSPDVILAVNGRRVDSTSELQNFLRNSDLKVGDKLKITLYKDAVLKDTVLRLESRGK
jgi:serine protease Do